MTNVQYIYNNAQNIRTTLNQVLHVNVTLSQQFSSRGLLAVINCQEKIGDEWLKGRQVFGIVSQLNDETQIAHILNRGRETCLLIESLNIADS